MSKKVNPAARMPISDSMGRVNHNFPIKERCANAVDVGRVLHPQEIAGCSSGDTAPAACLAFGVRGGPALGFDHRPRVATLLRLQWPGPWPQWRPVSR